MWFHGSAIFSNLPSLERKILKKNSSTSAQLLSGYIIIGDCTSLKDRVVPLPNGLSMASKLGVILTAEPSPEIHFVGAK